jgi:SNF2 family DNA or RNA helicase
MVEMSIQNYVVVCDEAHSMQSMTAARTKDVLTLVCDQRCVGVLLLTGTPMKNGKPLNLFPLLRAVRHPLGRHQKAYEQHFCQGRLKQFARGTVWDASGCSNLEQLRRLVRPNLLHMTKEECLKDLPPMSHVFHDVPASRSSQTEYRQAIAVLAKTHANATSDVQNGVTDEAVLGAMQSLRFVCARSKIDAAVELTRSILDEQPAVVVFTSFSRVAKEVHERLNSSGWPTELLTGETPQKKRQELVDKFQEGLSSVFVCTFGAGGVGVTLTAASTIILLDRPWTPGETRQAEDRIRRIGQTKACTSYWMRSFDLDKQIDEMLASKTRTTDAVLNRCTGSGAGVAGQQSQSYHNNGSGLAAPTAKISIKKLVESFVLSEAAKTGTVPGEV